MSFILKNDYFHIQKNRRKISFIYHKKLDNIIPSSLQQSGLVHEKREKDGKYFEIEFNNIDCVSYEEYLMSRDGQLSYIDIYNMIQQIGDQLQGIEKHGLSVPFIGPKDIMVFDKRYFIYLGTNLLPIERDGISLLIKKAYKKTIFFSPEMLAIQSLPNTVTKKSWIYSLGLLCIYSLSNDKSISGKSKVELMTSIDDIEITKVYFCIERCIEPDVSNRYYYFI